MLDYKKFRDKQLKENPKLKRYYDKSKYSSNNMDEEFSGIKNMPEKLRFGGPWVKYLAIILSTAAITAVLAGLYVFLWSENYFSREIESLNARIAELESQLSQSQSADIADWKNYRNEEIGIEFNYPSELAEPKVELREPDGRLVDSGKNISVSFEGTGIWFDASTKDYAGFLVEDFTGNEDVVSHCPKQISYSDRGGVCQIIKVDDVDAVLANSFDEYECSPRFLQRIYFNNQGNSKYTGLEFTVFPLDLNQKIDNLYNCESEEKAAPAYREALRQSKNIISRSNLSAKDQKSMEYLDQMISSFKFLN